MRRKTNTRATQVGVFSRGALGFKNHHTSLPAQIHLPSALAPGNVDHAAVPEFRNTKKALKTHASRLMHGSRTHLTNADIPLPKSIQVHKHQETKRQAKTHAHTHTHVCMHALHTFSPSVSLLFCLSFPMKNRRSKVTQRNWQMDYGGNTIRVESTGTTQLWNISRAFLRPQDPC